MNSVLINPYEFAGPSFALTDMANLELWLEADSLDALANNDPITTWPDLSGNSRDLVQNTAGNKPRFLTNQQGGLGGVDFSEDQSRFMPLPDFMSGFTAAEIFCLYKQVNAATNTGWHRIHDGASGAFQPFSNDQFYEAFGSLSRYDNITPAFDPKTAFRLYNVRSALNSYKVRQDNTEIFSTAVNAVAWDSANHKLGTNVSNNAGNCIILAVALFSATQNLTQRQQVTDFWNDKWSMSIPAAS